MLFINLQTVLIFQNYTQKNEFVWHKEQWTKIKKGSLISNWEIMYNAEVIQVLQENLKGYS